MNLPNIFHISIICFLTMSSCFTSNGSGYIATKEPAFSEGACGIDNPVRITEAAGIPLSQSALVDRETAEQFSHWMNTVVRPAARNSNIKIAEVQVLASYACRTRNHRKSGPLSQHAYGHAIDIGGFILSNGAEITLVNDYYNSHYSDFFKTIRRGACGPFGTVLGPGSDPYHGDHFHFDIASYRSGPFCK